MTAGIKLESTACESITLTIDLDKTLFPPVHRLIFLVPVRYQ